MKFKRSKQFAKSFIDVPRWMGWDFIRHSASGIAQNAKDLFTVQKATRSETFEQAVERLNLSEENLQQRAQNSLRLAKIFAGIALLIFCYAVYMLFNSHFIASLLSILAMMLALSFGFREHFWYFQIKCRRLGCSFGQWLNFLINGSR